MPARNFCDPAHSGRSDRPDVVQIRDVRKPKPRRNDILIRVRAAALTTSDARIRGLQYPPRLQLLVRAFIGLRAPRRIMGLVLSGEVEGVGSDVTTFKPGDEVFGFDNRFKFGGHAQYACWPAKHLLTRKPASLTHEQAAAIPYRGLMAMFFLRRGGVVGRPAGCRFRRLRRQRDVDGAASEAPCRKGDRRPQRPER